MRRNLLSAVRQMTSSRQSPNRSPLSAGVLFDPLLATQPSAVNNRSNDAVFQFHFAIQLPSRISRSGSASHQIAKLVLRGAGPMGSPFRLKSPPGPPQNSAPG